MGLEQTPLLDSTGKPIKVYDLVLSSLEKIYLVVWDPHLGKVIIHLSTRAIEKLTPELAKTMLIIKL